MNLGLVHTARLLAEAGRRRPSQANLRRSVSTSYYAVFHTLARLCADELVGPSRDATAEWSRVYRALEHGVAKSTLLAARTRSSDEGIRRFATIFVSLQAARHQADYDPHAPALLREDALEALVEAEEAVNLLAQLSRASKRSIAVRVLFRSRG